MHTDLANAYPRREAEIFGGSLHGWELLSFEIMKCSFELLSRQNVGNLQARRRE